MKILLVIYDNDSYIHWFPQGPAYIAAVLTRAGHDVTIYNQDVHHYPDKHLTEYLDQNKFDAVGAGVVAGYYQYAKLLAISAAINNSKNKPFYILGGHGPSPEPEYFLKKTAADATVIGEGENTIIELLDNLQNNKSLEAVKGIAYRIEDQVFINPPRPLIEDVDTIPIPAYDMFPMQYYRLLRMPHARNRDFVMPLLSGRGCTFNCSFCYRMDKGFRPRSNEAIVDEIKLLKSKYGITYIAFSDELLMSSVDRTASLCEDFLKENLDIKWDCNGRLNYAKPDLLKLMKRSGCVFINYGIEAMDDTVLKNMNKALNTSMIIKGIEATLAAGISPGYNIIFGNIGDNLQTLDKAVDFLVKYDDCSQMRTIRPVTPYPGCDLYYRAIDKGLLKDCRDFYENRHTNSDLIAINFTDLTDEQFHDALCDANSRLLKNYFAKKTAAALTQAEKLYKQKNSDFRGFRQS